MSDPAVVVERMEHVKVITINRPEARNAVNAEAGGIIAAALEEAESDDGIWAVVLTGAGEQAFCAGADLKAIARGESLYAAGLEHWGFAGWCRHFISKPTITAVNGIALGGGTEIVLASDLAVASETATFGLPEVKRGLIAAAGGTFRLGTQVPRKAALELLFTGESISAQRALELNLINSVVPAGEALAQALDLASRICANSSTAVQASKRLAHGATHGTWSGEEVLWQMSRTENDQVRSSPDGQEGPRAFAEKRPPIWQGS